MNLVSTISTPPCDDADRDDNDFEYLKKGPYCYFDEAVQSLDRPEDYLDSYERYFDEQRRRRSQSSPSHHAASRRRKVWHRTSPSTLKVEIDEIFDAASTGDDLSTEPAVSKPALEPPSARGNDEDCTEESRNDLGESVEVNYECATLDVDEESIGTDAAPEATSSCRSESCAMENEGPERLDHDLPAILEEGFNDDDDDEDEGFDQDVPLRPNPGERKDGNGGSGSSSFRSTVKPRGQSRSREEGIVPWEQDVNDKEEEEKDEWVFKDGVKVEISSEEDIRRVCERIGSDIAELQQTLMLRASSKADKHRLGETPSACAPAPPSSRGPSMITVAP